MILLSMILHAQWILMDWISTILNFSRLPSVIVTCELFLDTFSIMFGFFLIVTANSALKIVQTYYEPLWSSTWHLIQFPIFNFPQTVAYKWNNILMTCCAGLTHELLTIIIPSQSFSERPSDTVFASKFRLLLKF